MLVLVREKVFENFDNLRDLVAFPQFKKREKHLWWTATFSKIAG